MKPIIFIVSSLLLASPVFAREPSMLARVTVYWTSGGAVPTPGHERTNVLPARDSVQDIAQSIPGKSHTAAKSYSQIRPASQSTRVATSSTAKQHVAPVAPRLNVMRL